MFENGRWSLGYDIGTQLTVNKKVLTKYYRYEIQFYPKSVSFEGALSLRWDCIPVQPLISAFGEPKQRTQLRCDQTSYV